MKRVIYLLVAGLVLCAAGLTTYKVLENQQMSKFGDAMVKNLETFTQTEDDPIVIPPVVISCDGGGSGKCYGSYLFKASNGTCYAVCIFTGDMKDHCSAYCANLINICIAIMDYCAPIGFSDIW